MLENYEVRCKNNSWVVVDIDANKIVAKYPKEDSQSQTDAAKKAYELNHCGDIL